MTIADQTSPLHFYVAPNGSRQRIKLADLDKRQMLELIDSLQPRNDMLAGIVLFQRILDSTYDETHKCGRFLEFIEKAQNIMGSGAGKLLRYDFESQPGDPEGDPHTLGYTVHLKNLPMTRREALRHGFRAGLAGLEGILAGAFFIHGSADIDRAIHGTNSHKDASSATTQKRMSDLIVEYMDKNLWGALYIGIGATFAVDAGLNVNTIKRQREEELFDHQISNAVQEFKQRTSDITEPVKASRPRRTGGRHH